MAQATNVAWKIIPSLVGRLVRLAKSSMIWRYASKAACHKSRDHLSVEIAPRWLAMDKQCNGTIQRAFVEMVQAETLNLAPVGVEGKIELFKGLI
jgi:hypothetical protein